MPVCNMSLQQDSIALAKRDTVKAILSYSPDRLDKVIKAFSSNHRGESIINYPIFLCNTDGDESGVSLKHLIRDMNDVNGKTKMEVEEMIGMTKDDFTYPLHIAVVCVYHAVNKDPLCDLRLKQALRIIDVLLSHGANMLRGTGFIYLINIEGNRHAPFDRNYPNNRATNLAMFLKERAWKRNKNETHEYLDTVMRKIDAARPEEMYTKQILTDVATAYSKLLFSHDFSDVSFQCSDGVTVPAHKNILAVSSDYFKTAFQGTWAENNADGVWKTHYSSRIMKSILTILYTGSVKECNVLVKDKELNQMDLFELVSKYAIDMLVPLMTKNCIKSIKKSNLKEYLVKANMHSNEKLKLACFQFVKENMAEMLTDPDTMALASEDSDLWGELKSYLIDKPKKRPRTD